MALPKNSFDKIVPAGKAKTPSDLRFPTYAMVAPFKESFNTAVANNVWMKDIPKDQLKVDYDRAFAQWMELEQWIAANSLTYLIPNAGIYQDLIYCANIGIYIEPADLVIVSNFTSEPRRGEDEVGAAFFKMMKYKVLALPKDLHFEGEADLKYIRDDIYCGGYGMRSDLEAYEWIEKQCNIKITKCKVTDERQYHFDCQFNPITREKALVCTESFQPEDLKEVEKIVEIIDIPKAEAYCMACNIVRVGANILVASSITEMKASDENYLTEVTKIERLNQICSREGLGLVVFNLSEFDKSGAALSCLIFHCNFVDFQESIGEIM
jgi:N-dimethylarginine dimethylaminohydrolase